VGFNTTATLDRWRLAVQLYHESSHLGDEYRDTFNATRLDWTREIASAWVGYASARWKASACFTYVLVDQLGLRRPAACAAVDFRGNPFRLLGQRSRVIAGVFAEARSETDWQVSPSTKLGLAWSGEREGRELRLSLITHGGLSTQRQFYQQKSRYIGLELQFGL
jgi:hypothetical protein